MKRLKAFTLAELLITLAIIGVVAVLTMPVLISNLSERMQSEMQANTAIRFSKAMDQMRIDGKLEEPYASTDDFADVLVKYLPVNQRCKASNIAECWPSETVVDGNGEEISISKAKTGYDIGLKTATTDNVGLVLNTGAHVILAYQDDADITLTQEGLAPSYKDLPIGFGQSKQFAYGTNSLAIIDYIVDTNGKAGPNREYNAGVQTGDIRAMESASLANGVCSGFKDKEGSCYVNVGANYSLLNTCSDTTYDSNGTANTDCATNYWAGAIKACDDKGMKLPTKDELESLYKANQSSKIQGVPTDGWFWTSTEGNESHSYTVSLQSNTTYHGAPKGDNLNVICKGK